MNTIPRKTPRALLLTAGVLGLAGWGILAFYYRHGRIHIIAICALLVTLAMMSVIVRGRGASAKYSDIVLILALLSLILGIAAMMIVAL